ncbi:Transcription activator MBF2 [Popillia japonica]|uniref:Transcription activator MBF2 n=1 Tax=Popillia japonica TaxID=7064 RepID=A0AAW1MJT1_POPJA
MLKLLLLVVSLGIAYSIGVGNYYPYPQFTGWGCRQPVYSVNGSHSSFIGCVKPTDKLLFNQVYNNSGSYFGTTKKLITYPKRGYIRNETITGIWMFDYHRYGKGGYGRVISGGVGYKNVTIELRSYKWGAGFNFLIQIYGY